MRSAGAAYSSLALRASSEKANGECYTSPMFRRFLFCALLLAVGISASAQAPAQQQRELERQAHAKASAGDWAAAIASYDEALRISPRNLGAEIGLAQAYRGVHNYDEAKRVLERARAEHPQSEKPLAALGDLEIELQTYDAAIAHLRAALAIAPSDVESRNRLAVAYQAKGDLDSALAQIARVLARDPKNALAHYTRAKIYSDRNQDEAALPDAMKVVELQPQNPRGRLLLGKILLRPPQGESSEQAKERCGRAVATLEPLLEMPAQDSETLFLLSRAYECAGATEQAQKTLAAFEASSKNDRETKENQTQAKHLVQQANELALKNDFAGSLDLLQQAIAKDATYGAAYSQLAKLYYSARDIDKASEAISQALERDAYQPDFLYVQGKIFEKQGRLDEALSAFQRTTIVNPKESDAFFEMGAIYEQRGERERALAAYRKAVTISPDDQEYQRALEGLAGRAAKP
ncbi:MAG: tetratricopeptide repeat protein [Candidatus Acidiferrales bacterium]|jgi:tetratricopeptide (TPR) repeat protein